MGFCIWTFFPNVEEGNFIAIDPVPAQFPCGDGLDHFVD
jgi:hypothetical protein